jgi:tetratricopeptide (TPR) repeat protein
MTKPLETRPDDYWAWYNRGRVALEDLDWYEEAIASFEKALEARPRDYWSWYRQGDALRQLERYQEAIASYDQALERRPDDYWSWYRRGDALRHWGRLEEALTSYDKALESNRQTTGVGTSEVSYCGSWVDIRKPLPATTKRWNLNQKTNMLCTTKLAVMPCLAMLN